MEKVLVNENEYKQLQEAYKTLQALKNAGVDNWEGYSEAISEITEACDFNYKCEECVKFEECQV